MTTNQQLAERLESLERSYEELRTVFEAKESFVEEFEELNTKHEEQMEELEETHRCRVETLEKKQKEEVEEFVFKHAQKAQIALQPREDQAREQAQGQVKRSSKLPAVKRNKV
jgi:hypothetical protein